MDYRRGIGVPLIFLYLLFIYLQLIDAATSSSTTFSTIIRPTTIPSTTTATSPSSTTSSTTATTRPTSATIKPSTATTTSTTTMTITPSTTTTTPSPTTATTKPTSTATTSATTATTKPTSTATTSATTATTATNTLTTTTTRLTTTTTPSKVTTTPSPTTATTKPTSTATTSGTTATTATNTLTTTTTRLTTTTTPSKVTTTRSPTTASTKPTTTSPTYKITSRTITTPIPTTTARSTTTTTPPTTMTSPARNYCSDNPCKNGGTCSNIGGTYMYECTCAGGYTNYSCEIEINECDTLPCYPFGNCVDKINNYSCICRPGFKYVSDHYCSEINECYQYKQQHPDEAVCLNNGTCNDIINAFYCECTQIDEDLIIFGDRCEKNVPRYSFPIFDGISKNKGIQAGGSALTFTGKGLDTIQPIGAYFIGGLDVLFGYLKSGSVQSRSFIVLTPKAPNDSYVNRPLKISMLLSGGIIEPLSDSVTFTFVPNPTITDLEPKVLLASGGIKLTVQGSDLDAVGTPQMTATLREVVALNETGSTITYPPQTCFGATTTTMTCQMPKFNLGDSGNEAITPSPVKSREKRDLFYNLYSSFVKKAQHFYHSLVWNPMNPTLSGPHMPEFPFRNERLLKRRRRDGDSQNDKPVSTFSTDNKTYDLFLKFTLDNYPKYENLSKSLPNITLTMVDSKPEFKASANKKQQNYDPSKNEPLTIAGDRLLTGLTKDDYSVAVGVGSCDILSIHDNSMTCSPPAERPEDDNFSISCRNYPDHLAVVVTAAESENFICCIKYSSDDTGKTFLIIELCVGIGGPLLLLITVVVSVVITRRRRRLKKSEGHPGSVPIHSIGNASISPDYLNDDYNSHISGYNNNIGSTYYGQAIGTSDAEDQYTRRIGATTEGETSRLNSIYRVPKFKPFGFHVRPGKRISWTRPTKEDGMHAPSQRQRGDNKANSGKSKQKQLIGLQPASSDHHNHHSNDYPNMRNFVPGDRNILHEEVNLDDRDDPENHQAAYWSTGYNRYTSEPVRDSIATNEQNQNPLSIADINGYSRNIDEENYKPGQHLYGEALRRQPERSEAPVNDGTNIRRGNVKTYYPPVHD